ncbi:MAG TPA: L,D-transpeptidase family protein [Steroidobacteraceae bacterium]|nr:L,D-transpeptidase family protein [Steroidobacteraceae bacterium]
MHPPRITRTLACLVLSLALVPAASQQPAPADPAAAAIAAELEALMSPEPSPIHGVHIAMQELIQSFYGRRGFRPAWANARNAAELRRALADSAADGLDPADYELALLDNLAREIERPAATGVLRAQYDILHTEALLRLAYHLSFGKVDAESFDPQWNFGRTLAHRDVEREIEDALAAEDIYRRIEALKPTHRIYKGLKNELARYRAASKDSEPAAIPAGAALKPGVSDARIPLLRARLVASGDLESGAAAADPSAYDAPLEAAVRRFQARLGLESDGVIGAGTIAELNLPLAERIRQLRVNLDRGRVLLQDLPEKFVVVNIAGYTAYVIKGQDIVWSARVQVGKPYRKTPTFRSEINYLVFNPTWTVPPGIIRADILPAAKADPASITRKGLKVLDAGGRAVDPASIDWSRFSSGHIPYTLRQEPGPKNALGRVKLMFPNEYFVYLHDTPSQALFDRAERAFSSGCVRVERALELAAIVLDDPQQWNAQSIDAAIAGGKLQNVTLKRKVPVLLAYWTAWVDSEGRMNFRRDLYGQDAKWAAALDAPFKVRARPLFEAA